jgi:hypothetical protein
MLWAVLSPRLGPFVAAVLTLCLSACGAAMQPEPTPAPVVVHAPLPGVTELVYRFQAQQHSSAYEVTRYASEQMRDALLRAGVQLGDNRSDASLTLTYSVEEEQILGGLVVVQRSDGKRAYKITATLSAFDHEGILLDRFPTVFSSTDDASANMRAVVAAFLRSARVAKVGDKKRTAGQAKEVAAKTADLAAYNAGQPKVCAAAATLGACQGVEQYLRAHPDGANAAEARQLIEAAEPKLASLQKDEDYWLKSGHEECAQTRVRDACSGVDLYLMKYPKGMHATEARALTVK